MNCPNCNGAGYFLSDFEIPGGGERMVTSSGYECEICYGAGTLPEPSAPRLLPPLDGDPIPRVSWSWSALPPNPIPRRFWRWRPYRATEPFESWVYGEGDAVTGIPPGVTVEIESRLSYEDTPLDETRGPWLPSATSQPAPPQTSFSHTNGEPVLSGRDDAIAKHILDTHLVTFGHVVDASTVHGYPRAWCRDCDWQYPTPGAPGTHVGFTLDVGDVIQVDTGRGIIQRVRIVECPDPETLQFVGEVVDEYVV